MGFGEAIGAFYRRSFDFETRSTRSEFWWAKLFKTIVYFTIFMVMGLTAEAFGGTESETGEIVVGFAVIVMFLFYLANFIPNIAVAVRRFHDQNQSGWMYLLALIPYIGGLIVLIFMCIDGTHGDNRFGPDPLGDSLFDTFS